MLLRFPSRIFRMNYYPTLRINSMLSRFDFAKKHQEDEELEEEQEQIKEEQKEKEQSASESDSDDDDDPKGGRMIPIIEIIKGFIPRLIKPSE